MLSEFSSQLPHDGGAFYSNESIENVRPYYRSAWPPMLYAAALWLSSGGFDSAVEEEEDASPTAPTVTPSSASSPVKTPESINKDRFYLLLGKRYELLLPFAQENISIIFFDISLIFRQNFLAYQFTLIGCTKFFPEIPIFEIWIIYFLYSNYKTSFVINYSYLL